MPIVSDEVSVNWRGSSGKTPVGQRDRDQQEGGEHRLGHEQPRDALDVAQDLAALVDHRADPANSPLTSTRSATARAICVAAALGDRQPGLLERGHVVDAVAEHADVSPLAAAPHDARLVLGRDPPDRGRARAPPRAARRPSRAGCAPSSALAAPGMPASRAIAPTVAGLSPETPSSRPPRSAKNATVRRASVAQPLGEDDDPQRRAAPAAARRARPAGAARPRRRAPARAARPPPPPTRRSRRARARRAAPRARRARAGRRRARARSSGAATRTAPGRRARGGVTVGQARR